MNVKLLRKIQRHILAEPKRFIMGTTKSIGTPGETIAIGTYPCGYNNHNKYEQVQKFASCGTAACIMGWARILDTAAYAKDEETYGKLCSANDWPKKFANRYAKAKTPLARARIASARIDHFIKTKGAE